MSRHITALATAVLIVAGLGIGGLGVASAAAPEIEQTEKCAETVVLVARGSDQNTDGKDILPRQTTAGYSNGYEGENLRVLVDKVQWGPGTRVLPLDADAYPADMQLPTLFKDEEDAELSSAALRIGEVLRNRPAEGYVAYSLGATRRSLERGAAGLVAQVDAIEATGCRPNYVIIGYSQGAVLAQMQEKTIRDRTSGRLRGVVYVGNPLLRPGETRFGGATGNGALAGWTGMQIPGLPNTEATWDVPRLNYCVPGDFVCDTTLGHALEALANASGVHAEYFITPRETDQVVVDTLEEWTS